MESTPSTSSAQVLMNKGKKGAAAYIYAEFANVDRAFESNQHLNDLLDILLSPHKPINDWETLDWIKWLMAGGRTPDEFSTTGDY